MAGLHRAHNSTKAERVAARMRNRESHYLGGYARFVLIWLLYNSVIKMRTARGSCFMGLGGGCRSATCPLTAWPTSFWRRAAQRIHKELTGIRQSIRSLEITVTLVSCHQRSSASRPSPRSGPCHRCYWMPHLPAGLLQDRFGHQCRLGSPPHLPLACLPPSPARPQATTVGAPPPPSPVDVSIAFAGTPGPCGRCTQPACAS